jgi:hypothetical protein
MDEPRKKNSGDGEMRYEPDNVVREIPPPKKRDNDEIFEIPPPPDNGD